MWEQRSGLSKQLSQQYEYLYLASRQGGVRTYGMNAALHPVPPLPSTPLPKIAHLTYHEHPLLLLHHLLLVHQKNKRQNRKKNSKNDITLRQLLLNQWSLLLLGVDIGK